LLLGQLPIAVLGVLVISAEYSSGSIRSSLAAVPARVRFLTAKAVVITIVGFVTGLVTCFPSYYLGMAFFNARHEGVGLGEPHVLRAVIGGALLLTVTGLFGYAIGILLRHTATAITVSVGLLFLIPVVLAAIPADIVRTINKYFLASAGDEITSVLPQPDALAPWTGYSIYVAQVALLLAVAAALMVRRDA
jgi:ABC-type transport system involved in multi-copper enzyme maturation permease subunit